MVGLRLSRTRVVVVDRHCPDRTALAEAGRLCREGRLVAFPTETVYGLGTNALDPHAVARLRAAKQRPPAQAFSVMVASVAAARPLVDHVSEPAERLIQRFLPGPLTVVLWSSAAVSDILTGGSAKIGIRVPEHPIARAFLEASDCPVVAPSANVHGMPSPRSAADVLAQLDGVIDLVLDGGPSDIGVDSTVIDMTTDPPTILRAGAINAKALEDALGRSVLELNRPD